jgi:hypothetical protein
MRVARTALCLALAGSLLGAGVAGAATRPKPKPKPVCNLVTDDKGDADQGLTSASSQPAWDIVSADVATDTKNITTVIRVAKLSKAVSDDPLGSQWRFDFTVDGIKLFTQATSTPFGDAFTIGYSDTTSHGFASSGATGVFDTAKNEVRVTAPLSSTSSKATIKVGTKLTALEASDGDYVNTAGGSPSGSFQADDALGAKSYTGGVLSCVKVGK